MDFDEYLKLQASSFVQYYRCLPTSLVNRGNVDEDGNKVLMPPSALDKLTSLNIEYPMQFRIQNPSTGRVSHCGVLEFVADEGFIHIPTWLMTHLGLEANDLVLVQQKAFPKATFLKLQAHTKDFLDVSHPRELLEHNVVTRYACLTVGETITVTEGDRRYYLDVVELQPEDAVSVIETDCNVDFAPPLDYVEPPQPQPTPAVPAGRAEEQPAAPRFTGVAARMDGKPVELPTAPAPAAATAGAAGTKLKRGIRFGGGLSKGKEEGAGGKEQEQRFTGTAYSFQ